MKRAKSVATIIQKEKKTAVGNVCSEIIIITRR